MPWNPYNYETFADARMRPAIDLLNRVSLNAPRTIVDLGCGSGNVTLLLAQRWPSARITGVDGSEAMLAAARVRSNRIDWQQADLTGWRPAAGCELVFSNAALHWLPRHDRLLVELADSLPAGGVLAVQMPRNFSAPSHVTMYDLALEVPYREHLEPMLRPEPVAAPGHYQAVLATHVASLDIWETEYLQVLSGENPVADWTRSTWLAPHLDALPAGLRGAFEAEYRRRILAAYPKTAQGTTLFPFRRLFLVARAAE